MRRLLLLGTVICGAVVVAQAWCPGSPAPAAAQPTERVGFRTPPPTCEQAIKDLGLEGQPVSCEEPPSPTYDPPQMHGKYRLFPESYVGLLPYEDWPDTAPPGVVSDGLETIKRPRCTSSLPGCRTATAYRPSTRTATTQSTSSWRNTRAQGSR